MPSLLSPRELRGNVPASSVHKHTKSFFSQIITLKLGRIDSGFINGAQSVHDWPLQLRGRCVEGELFTRCSRPTTNYSSRPPPRISLVCILPDPAASFFQYFENNADEGTCDDFKGDFYIPCKQSSSCNKIDVADFAHIVTLIHEPEIRRTEMEDASTDPVSSRYIIE